MLLLYIGTNTNNMCRFKQKKVTPRLTFLRQGFRFLNALPLSGLVSFIRRLRKSRPQQSHSRDIQRRGDDWNAHFFRQHHIAINEKGDTGRGVKKKAHDNPNQRHSTYFPWYHRRGMETKEGEASRKKCADMWKDVPLGLVIKEATQLSPLPESG